MVDGLLDDATKQAGKVDDLLTDGLGNLQGTAAGLGAAADDLFKPYFESSDSRYKRAKFREGVRDQVWNNAKSSDGNVYDPVTGDILDPSEPWDMGHKPGYEHRKHVESASKRNIDRETFLDEYNNPGHYRPEKPSSNRSHAGENHTDEYFGP